MTPLAGLLRLALVLLVILAAAASRPAPSQHDSPPESAIPGASLEATGNHAAPTRTEAPPTKPSEGPPPVTTAGPRPVPRGPQVSVTPHPSARVAQRQSARPSKPAVRGSTPRPSTTPECGKSSCTGLVSWYGTGGPGMYAAMHDYIDGTRVSVVVCAFPDGHATCITVPVVTQCGACRWAKGAVLVDLSVPAFKALGVPLSVGLAKVTVQVLG